MTKPLTDLTELQLLILGVLWELGEATASEVHERLGPTTGLARKTVGTMLHRLERQGVVAFREDGREYRYRPAVRREDVQAARLEGLVGGLFGGDVTSMMAFALQRGEVDPAALARLRAMLRGDAPPEGR